ncbi:hypothetical protein F4778DRAFT_767318 [Xylariomycetidae sp. FL2044]|nr:hypothetical protein F4778DRAFT_767318 [Xylariomycetidae sp. FL2044]
MRYALDRGILDLARQEPRGEAYIFCIEVNCRPPGFDCTFSSLYTYGVDFCGLHYLQALGDRQRYHALASPFVKGAQYWCANAQIPIHRENILVPENFHEKVLEQLPDIAPFVSRGELFTQPGNVISPRGGVGFVGYFLLYSRTSRRHLLEMCSRVQAVAIKVLDS